jgi:hypothetical protein
MELVPTARRRAAVAGAGMIAPALAACSSGTSGGAASSGTSAAGGLNSSASAVAKMTPINATVHPPTSFAVRVQAADKTSYLSASDSTQQSIANIQVRPRRASTAS